MNFRRITSLVLVLSFVFVVLTSIVLYVVPEGRIAYWADWRWLGWSKEQWGAVHINTGFLFLAALIVHLWYNWKMIMAYLKDRSKRVKVFTREFNVALALLAITVLGTHFMIPPFSTVLHIGEGFKDAAEVKYGSPPYGHAELSSLKLLAKRTGTDLDAGMESLRSAGFKFTDESESVKDIAAANDVTPKVVWDVFSSAKKPDAQAGEGGSGSVAEAEVHSTAEGMNQAGTQPSGLGRMSLAELCQTLGVPIRKAEAALREAGVEAEAEQKVREIAERAGMTGGDLYEMLKGL